MKLIKIKIGNKIFYIKNCKGFSSIRGLMFDSMENHDGALIYGNAIWMPFVKQNLNLIFLDENFRAIEQRIAVPISLNRASWKIYKSKNAKYCLELKDTRIKVKRSTKIKLGP